MIAICSLVRKPFNFDTWVNYHISIGVSKFLLSVEDTPELKEVIDSYGELIEAEYVSMSTMGNKSQSKMTETIGL